jgi:catechol 2,3-dioxygenase-like lactoylglutathione lyase family enzyme
MVQGVDNIGICTTDVERSVAFYQRLGFSEAYRNDAIVRFNTIPTNNICGYHRCSAIYPHSMSDCCWPSRP